MDYASPIAAIVWLTCLHLYQTEGRYRRSIWMNLTANPQDKPAPAGVGFSQALFQRRNVPRGSLALFFPCLRPSRCTRVVEPPGHGSTRLCERHRAPGDEHIVASMRAYIWCGDASITNMQHFTISSGTAHTASLLGKLPSHWCQAIQASGNSMRVVL